MSKLLVRVTDRQLLFRLWFCTARHFGEVNVDYVTTGAKTGLKGHKFLKLLWNWKSYLEVQFPPFLPPPPPAPPHWIPSVFPSDAAVDVVIFRPLWRIIVPTGHVTCVRRNPPCRHSFWGGGVWSLVSCLFFLPNLIYQDHLKMDYIFTVPIRKSSTMWVKDRCRGFLYSIPVSGGSVFLITPSDAYLKLLLFPLRGRLYPLISSAYR